MLSPIIKICGIRDPAMATQAVLAGANWIGIIFHPQSPRYVPLEEATAIASAVIKAGAVPVGVFVNHTAIEIQAICEATNIHTIQLHGAIARSHHHLLATKYQRVYVQAPAEYAELAHDSGLRYLDPQRDFILIDHPEPGCGHTINHTNFRYKLSFPWFLAGGLTPLNVCDFINNFHPNGVDVSSGVESSRGNKDLLLIQQFVRSVRGNTDDK